MTDTSARATRPAAHGAGVVTGMMLTIGLFVFLALPAAALADNGGDHVDGWGEAAAAAAAAAGAGALAAAGGAAARRNPGPPRPLPPPELRRERANALRDAADQMRNDRQESDRLQKAREKALRDAASSGRRRR